jgi:prepilin-type N-terminal cleavage/methylation domain-containing protein
VKRGKSRSAGFTLIEMSVVILIIGLIMGISVSAWVSMKDSQEYAKVKTQLAVANDCLLGQAITSESLPSKSWFERYCQTIDPWGTPLEYENSCGTGDETCQFDKIDNTTPEKRFKPSTSVTTGETGLPGAVWLISSNGPNRDKDLTASETLWDCTNDLSADKKEDRKDDLCEIMSKNRLYYEMYQ